MRVIKVNAAAAESSKSSLATSPACNIEWSFHISGIRPTKQVDPRGVVPYHSVLAKGWISERVPLRSRTCCKTMFANACKAASSFLGAAKNLASRKLDWVDVICFRFGIHDQNALSWITSALPCQKGRSEFPLARSSEWIGLRIVGQQCF
jgi:hypothetical protein